MVTPESRHDLKVLTLVKEEMGDSDRESDVRGTITDTFVSGSDNSMAVNPQTKFEYRLILKQIAMDNIPS